MASWPDPGWNERLSSFFDVIQVRQLLALAAATSFCVPEIFISLDSSSVPSDSLSQVILAPEALQMERIVSPPRPTFNDTSDRVLGPGWPPPPEKPLCAHLRGAESKQRRERPYGDPRRAEGAAGFSTLPASRPPGTGQAGFVPFPFLTTQRACLPLH